MRPLSRFFGLSSDERRLLLGALFLVGFVRLLQGRLRFTTLRRLVVGRPRRLLAAPAEAERVADRVVWAVSAVSARAGCWTTCLTQALATQALLARRGVGSRLHVGVVRGAAGQVEAHAWVERDGRVLVGGTAADVARFAPLTVLDVADGGGREVDDARWPVVGAVQGGR
jgi:hypothetical protein